MMRSNKGILLTLVTIVLLILMIAELITYVYLTVNYETVSSVGSVSSGGYKLADTISIGTVSFLHSSLYSALNTLSSYENSTNKGAYLINNTAYALQSLMSNGMLYGTNEITPMGGTTLVNYTNAIVSQARSEGFNVIIANSSLQVYQSSSSSINVTYTALAIINSSSGLFTYPITSSSGLLLNGSPDLYSVENNNNYKINLTGGYPTASVVGNVYAISGSTSPFQFVYGTVIVENGISTCSSIPARFQNKNYILAIPNDVPGVCGFGGVVTYTPSGTYNVPYLVYSSSSNVISYLNNGTSLLLDGAGLSLLNVSALQSAIHSGAYFSSAFAPSYLDWAQGSVNKRSQNGMFSFNIYNRLVPIFQPGSSSSISTNVLFGPSSTQISLSVWFNPKNSITTYTNTILLQEGPTIGNVFELGFKNSELLFGSQVASCNRYITSAPVNGIIYPGTWHNIVAVFNSTGTDYIYLDGVQVASGSFTLCNSRNTAFVIGSGIGTSFNGSLANIQTYNISLSPQQASKLYYEGLDGIVVSSKNLTGWWPLNGNAKDYSGRGFNGNVFSTTQGNSISYEPLYNYFGDPVYDGSFYSGNLNNLIAGISNCGNLNQCSSVALQHAALGPSNLSSSSAGSSTEAATFGLANAVVPNVGAFNGNGYVLGQLNSYYGADNQFSVSAWAYLNSTTNGPVIDIVGCAVPPGTCSSTSVISLSKNTIYVTLPGVTGITYASANGWHHIALTYTTSGTANLYVDGVSVGTGGGAYSGNGGTVDYWTTSCGSSCTLPAGVSNTLYGKIGDIQFYKVQLTGAQVSQLYQNDSVIGVNADNRWPLSIGYAGFVNKTINTANSLDPALFANNQGVCSDANVVNYICGATYSQP